ncbi:hypothetical protein LR48_Vigan01g222700 [Vigna angularis]|uniref:DUF4378 domain-containing protein n=3 Tax=Phaseolus angularis TaxID=3914 RepID=A0A0L9TQB7_PHAAN|nr:uncharacterized protein LOC108329219 [Vigna angularis]KOM32671.1 hypothetical protein LR48_Vigan01g222700 [Vigna angularis]BAT75943.1 hypothetical protein VIGAN_01388100 [Vigna angularis var. angularis]
MAFAAAKPFSNNSLMHTTKHPPKRPLLLKDYLRDDLGSCSSNGFKSLPRRRCCTTVGFFVEKDLQLQRKTRNTLPRRRRSSVSALQRASVAVINAIKSLPTSQKGGRAKRGGVLCRSLSRKLLSRSFWKKAAVVREEGSQQGVPRRRTSFRELIMLDQEHHKATSFIEYTALAAPSFTTSSGCGSNSWGESEFTFASTAASSESSNENYLLLETTKEYTPRRHKVEEEVVTKEYWANEKEQFSPVSILDCPFVDEEEIYKCRFRSTSSVVSITEGRKHKHMHERCHLESVASPEPVILEKRFARLEAGDETLKHSTKQRSRVVVPAARTRNNLRPANNHDIEENARNLLNFVKGSNPQNTLILKAENLLFDYFKKSVGECKEIDLSKKLHLCKVAEDWINGRPQELYLDWEEQGRRSVYVREMDRCEGWKNYDQEIQQLGGDLANEVLTILVNESVLDLMIRASH